MNTITDAKLEDLIYWNRFLRSDAERLQLASYAAFLENVRLLVDEEIERRVRTGRTRRVRKFLGIFRIP